MSGQDHSTSGAADNVQCVGDQVLARFRSPTGETDVHERAYDADEHAVQDELLLILPPSHTVIANVPMSAAGGATYTRTLPAPLRNSGTAIGKRASSIRQVASKTRPHWIEIRFLLRPDRCQPEAISKGAHYQAFPPETPYRDSP